MLRPLRIRDFALLWSGMTVSMIGDGIYAVALPFLVFSISNLPTALSVAAAMWMIPQVLLLLFGGVLTDRFDRRRVMIASDVIRGGAIGAIGVLAVSGVLELWHLYVLVAVYGAGEALFMPAFSAIVPDVVSRDLLIEANSLENLVRPIAIRIVGPAIGGVTVSAWGPGEAFVIDAATFAVSGVAVLLMVPHPVESKGKATLSTAVAEIAEGFRFIRSRTWLWAGLAATAIGLLAFSGPWQVLVPFVVRNQMGGDAGDFALVLGAAGAGAIVASTVVGSRSIPRGPIVYIFGTWSIGTLLLAAMAPASSVWQAATVAFFILGLVTAGQIVWSTLQQTLVPRELLGRVASVDWFVSTSLIPVSFIVVGPLAEGVGADVALVGAGVLGAAGFIVFLLIPGTHDLTAVRGIE